MLDNTRKVSINGKEYILTATRRIVFKLAEIAPELLKIAKDKSSESEKDNVEKILGNPDCIDAIDKIYAKMPELFYELIKIKQPMSRETSDNIYYNFTREYNDVEDNLLEFIETSFTDGVPREQKKNLNWF